MSARIITSIVTAAALAVTLGSASPVQAGHNDDVKRFLGAAIGLYILGQAIDNNHRKRVIIQRHPQRHHHGKWKKKRWQQKSCGRHGGHNGWNSHGQRCW
ncbi:hypothetical protein KUW09_05235 [Mameliella alba]|nr:hypothetical protein [Antarctobacter heliothermus]MBY6143433.1 hypothetical protein [Mameliella alba]MCA0952843.1 hypothetical protein [Mameliella alba]